jgi:hypothetical protein
MKLKLFAIFIIVTFFSCKAAQFTIGMSEAEFKSLNKVTLVKATKTISIYEKITYPVGKPAAFKFFYFTNGILTQVDEGQRNPDLIIERR